MTSETSNQTSATKSSLIDLPLQSADEDLLLTNDFPEALINFIEHSDTPITIALQGEWGRGKTSVLNAVSLPLCGKTFYDTNSTELNNKYKSLLQPSYYGVFINAWHFSLDSTPEQAVLGILSSIVNQLSKLNSKSRILKNIKNALIDIAKKHGSTIVKEVSSQLGAPAIVTRIGSATWNFIVQLFTKTKSKDNSEIKQLKHNIELLIKETIKHDHTKTGVILFIDDLDRIDPGLAVGILEILKNIFDIDHCISIIAIDYNIFIKGMESRLGEYTSNNKHEFQLYYEKMVHLSLSMPRLYYINNFVKKIIVDSGLFTYEDLYTSPFGEDVATELYMIIEYSVGERPRSIKRLANTLSFIISYNNKDLRKVFFNNTEYPAYIYKRIFIFAITCLQLTYPDIHRYLIDNPNFLEWQNGNNELGDETIDQIQSDTPWHSKLRQLCCQDAFSEKHFKDIDCIFCKMNQCVKEVTKAEPRINPGALIIAIVNITNVANVLYRG